MWQRPTGLQKLRARPQRPIQNEKERSEILAALQVVDYVVIFEEDTPLNLLEKIQPSVHVKGGSFIKERIEEEQALLAQWKGIFKNFPLEEGYSTTSIIERILRFNEG